MDAAKLTLREQNRIHTGAIIHEVTYKLVKANGLADTSIDDIAKAASISRRTFFNYYASKENALIGLMHPILPDDAVATFNRSDKSILLRCAHLVLAAYRSSIANGSTMERRKELRSAHPEVIAKFALYINELEQLVEPIVTKAHSSGSDSTKLMLHVAGAVIRYCHQIDPSMSETTLQNAIETLYETTKGTTDATR